MSEVLLQTIIEKLESFEIAFLKASDAGKDDPIRQSLLKEIIALKSEFTIYREQFSLVHEKMNEVIKSVSALKFRLDIPLPHNTKHSHHLHKGSLVALAFFVLASVSLYGWARCSNLKDQFEANDFKYRFLKVNGGAGLSKITHDTDSLYNSNTIDFTSKVAQAEQQLAEKLEMLRLAREKEKEARELINKAGKR